MSCKKEKKTNISVITAPGTTYPSSGSVCNRHTWVPWAGCFPHSGCSGKTSYGTHFPLFSSSALSPGSGVHRSTNLASALATRGTEEQKARRRLPSCKRQPATPQKKIWIPQCSLGRMGGEAQPQLPSRVAEKDLQFNPGLRAGCKQQPLAGRPSSIYSACWICV